MSKQKYQKPLHVDLQFEEAIERFAQTDPKEVTEAALEEQIGMPLRIIEEADTGHRFVVYTSKRGVEFDIRFDGNEPWFTQLQLAEMFGVAVSTVNGHIKKFMSDGELTDSVIRDFHITARDGREYAVKHYGLDAAFYVGYRVNSKEGVLFRRWATEVLVSFATKAFVVDVRRLENPEAGGPDYFDDLLEKIRDIRSSEKRLYTRIRELASLCSDYGVATKDHKNEFFSTIQNALHWAATQHTAAEVIHSRVDRKRQNAGLTSFAGDLPTVVEATVAKNYYSEPEIKALNHITSLALEFFESQAEQRRPTTLGQFIAKMWDLLKLDGRPLLVRGHKGSVSKQAADKKAAIEVKAYREAARLKNEAQGEQLLIEMSEAIKARKKPKKLEKKGS